jgi:putative tricarboxylic transport membrane protein
MMFGLKDAARFGAAAAMFALVGISLPAWAESSWQPEKAVEIIVGTNPGTGFDRTARVFQKVAQDAKLIDVATTVVNKPGGSGAIGYAYMNAHQGDGDYIAVISPLVLSNNLTGASPLQYTDMTPLTILMGEEIAVAVKSDSPIKTGTDLLNKLKQDPASVSIALSGVGGQNHITIGLIGKAAGIDIKKLKIVGFTGSSEALTAALGGHVDALVAPASTIAPHIKSGAMRGLGIASDSRLGGELAGIPTWKEQGIDVVFSNWRGFIGPGGLNEQQVAYWDGVFAKASASHEWQDELNKNQLTSRYLDSTHTKEFLAQENDKLATVLKDLGLAK